VLSLALGIGANTAIFSLVSAVLIRPLSFNQPDMLVMVWEDASFAGFPLNTPAPANYADWKAQNHVFEGMAATEWRDFSLTGDGEPEKVSAYGVTSDFFPLLGVEPALGRVFLPEEDRPDATKTAVISYSLWQARYGGEPSILGRDILLNGEKYTVVGVMPAGFQFLEPHVKLWVPMAFTPDQLAARGSHYLTVVARMKPGITVEQARAEIASITAGIAHEHPAETWNGRLGSVVLPLRDQITSEVRSPLMVLLVAVGFVLLIACVNVANLLLSRAAGRRKEIAVRTALGATRTRIVRQMLTESVLLAAIGGAAGLMFAAFSFDFLEKMIPDGMTLTTRLRIDPQVLGYTLLLSMLTGVVFGLAPALQASRVDLIEALKQGGGRSGVGSGNRLRSGMVVAEVALALVLLVGAGLLIQTLVRLRDQYDGLRPESVLTLRTVLSPNRYKDHQQRVNFFNDVLDRVTKLPGVVGAGYCTSVPLEWKGGTSGFWVEGREPIASLSYDANNRQVSTDYLQAMGIQLRRGRYFTSGDVPNALPAVIVNETMARQYWPDEDAMGKRFKVGNPDSPRPWLTIVGIVADVRQMGVDVPVKAEMYLPLQQTTYTPWFSPRDLVVRTTGDPMSLAAAVRSQIRSVDPEQPVSNIRTMDEILDEQTAPRRLGMTLLVAFASLALLLASLGIYGVLSYFVVQHTSEIGVRLALGANRTDVLGFVLKKGLSLVAAGVAIGLASAAALTRLMASLLYGVSATDPLTYAAIAGLLIAVAVIACYLPARRATNVDPMIALRCE
jgi:putative ABC transport system permease protein